MTVTGKTIDFAGAEFFEVHSGKIATERNCVDSLELNFVGRSALLSITSYAEPCSLISADQAHGRFVVYSPST
jgi:hypothetical protein